MSLTNKEKELLRNSWSKISSLGLQAVGLHIFVRLFTEHSDVIPLFKNIISSDIEVTYENLERIPSMAAHALSVAETINEVVACLDVPKTFVEFMEEIAKMHKNKNVVPVHFEALGKVILKVIESVLGDDAKDDVMKAWAKAYGTIQTVVLSKM